MQAVRLFSPTEAAAVAGIAVKAVNNAIDKRIVVAVRNAGKTTRQRAVSSDGLLQLKLWSQIGGILSQERREKLFEAIMREPNASQVRADDLLIIDVAEARKQIAARTQELEEAEAMIAQDKAVMGGEPLFKGTRIPVRLIASMLEDGVSEEEILAGYPKLTSRHLALAPIWVAAHPRRGRPKPVKDDGLLLKQSHRVKLVSDATEDYSCHR
ncbi:DUF433 domain-containing protein [Novosphingobium sp. KACC 22771]|uniref:DUF433 domain-containing protein n=1 Tax=Novosphingobium sp. KACC 22771 TaxID=3025670 RepID=UPI002365B0AE|nr:DUF433 domain-containing protein [Novosphingobium sp. KACC 22771]WDF72489.1 DUF433 domain-containing protein [Novosphingobium sp. KACC 22771]